MYSHNYFRLQKADSEKRDQPLFAKHSFFHDINSYVQIHRKIICSLVAVVFIFIISSSTTLKAQDSCGIRISIITCGVGEDLYSCYGHSAVRVIDSCAQTDIVYNYGTFDFGDPQFYYKFTRGKLLYYLAQEQYNRFMSTYISEGRSVYEQVLDLNHTDAVMIQTYLVNNLKEENRYYHYDFLLDNCSTRIRDIFTDLFKVNFKFGYSMTDDSCSFRTILDQYEKDKHWERFGVNLLMSNVVDDKMTNLQSMFLPDYLMKGFTDATLHDHRVVAETIQLLPQRVTIPSEPNHPRIIFWVLFFIILALSFKKKFQTALLYFDVFFFMILGLLGCFMLFMWFGTEHVVCRYNRNLMWAFPLHLVFAFLLPRGSDLVAKYARYASWLVILSMIYGMFAIQQYIPEITPILLLIIIRLGRYSRQTMYFNFNQR